MRQLSMVTILTVGMAFTDGGAYGGAYGEIGVIDEDMSQIMLVLGEGPIPTECWMEAPKSGVEFEAFNDITFTDEDGGFVFGDITWTYTEGGFVFGDITFTDEDDVVVVGWDYFVRKVVFGDITFTDEDGGFVFGDITWTYTEGGFVFGDITWTYTEGVVFGDITFTDEDYFPTR